jgi:hypothetical protein
MPARRADTFGSAFDTDSRRVMLYCAAAVAVGNCVMIDTADTTNGAGFSVKQSSAADSPLAIGICTVAGPAGGYCEVQVGGYSATPTPTAAAINVGSLVGSAASGAIVAVGTIGATVWPFAVCVDAYTSATVDGIIMIMDKGFYKHA